MVLTTQLLVLLSIWTGKLEFDQLDLKCKQSLY